MELLSQTQLSTVRSYYIISINLKPWKTTRYTTYKHTNIKKLTCKSSANFSCVGLKWKCLQKKNLNISRIVRTTAIWSWKRPLRSLGAVKKKCGSNWPAPRALGLNNLFLTFHPWRLTVTVHISKLDWVWHILFYLVFTHYNELII